MFDFTWGDNGLTIYYGGNPSTPPSATGTGTYTGTYTGLRQTTLSMPILVAGAVVLYLLLKK
jgi:hypothetical protein